MSDKQARVERRAAERAKQKAKQAHNLEVNKALTKKDRKQRKLDSLKESR